MRADKLYLELIEAIKRMGSQPVCMTTDPEAWYPDQSNMDNHSRNAIKLCKQCPVMNECAAYAIWAPEHFGIWGGLLPRQRQAIRNAGRSRAA